MLQKNKLQNRCRYKRTWDRCSQISEKKLHILPKWTRWDVETRPTLVARSAPLSFGGKNCVNVRLRSCMRPPRVTSANADWRLLKSKPEKIKTSNIRQHNILKNSFDALRHMSLRQWENIWHAHTSSMSTCQRIPPNSIKFHQFTLY